MPLEALTAQPIRLGSARTLYGPIIEEAEMAEDLPEEVKSQDLANATTLGKNGAWVASAVTGIGAAAIALVESLENLDTALAIGLFAVVGVGLLVLALIIATDIRARARVKVAQLRAAVEGGPAKKAPGDGLSQWSSTSARMAVKVAGNSERLEVIALRHNADGKTWYLVGRQGMRPSWVENNEIQETFHD